VFLWVNEGFAIARDVAVMVVPTPTVHDDDENG
jgi:hypothetical protein